MPKIVKIHPLSPQKISKSGNEGILSYGQFCNFSPILWLGGWGCPPRKGTPNFGLRSTNLWVGKGKVCLEDKLFPSLFFEDFPR